MHKGVRNHNPTQTETQWLADKRPRYGRQHRAIHWRDMRYTHKEGNLADKEPQHRRRKYPYIILFLDLFLWGKERYEPEESTRTK